MEHTTLENRHIHIDGKRTSISMERVYWQSIEFMAAGSNTDWEDETVKILKHQPSSYKSRSAFLRYAIMNMAYRNIKRLQDKLADATSAE